MKHTCVGEVWRGMECYVLLSASRDRESTAKGYDGPADDTYRTLRAAKHGIVEWSWYCMKPISTDSCS